MPLCTIVGAGSGLGASLMRRFARENYRVAILGRRPDMLESVLESEPARHGNCRSFVADAARAKSLGDAFRAVTEWAGETDVLIYNAAVLKGRLASKLTAGHMASDMAVNLGGALSAIGQVLPAMRRRGQGTILLTGGSLALDPIPAWAALGASKAALRSFSLGLAREVRSDGVRVAMIQICGRIEPGGFFDPDLIADTYWSLHHGNAEAFREEIIYKPEAEARD
jgi:NADP-dependent 3-hydroxy acid dehydrogenase YdfG